MFDLVVVGGNISGLSAAINAAERSVSTVVIERNMEPLYPPRCGEGTDAVTWRLFEVEGCSRNEINSIKVNITDSWSDVFKLARFRLIVFDRFCVEKKLLSKAESMGVQLILGRRLKDFQPPYRIILDNGESVEGKVVIDASGISCQVGRRINISPLLKPVDVGICMQSRVEASFNKSMIHLWFHKPYAPFGYAWVFPINNRLANIGVGVPGGFGVNLEESLKGFIEYVTSGEGEVLSTFRACVPTASPLTRVFKDNVMVVGDAARLVNPVFGKGISNAVFSGIIAGRVAAKYIQGEIDSLSLYQQIMEGKISFIKKFYKKKVKSMRSEDIFIRSYKRVFSMLHGFHRLAPIFFENRVIHLLEKDVSLVENFK